MSSYTVYTGMVYLHRESLNGVVTGSTWEIFYHKIHKEMVPRTVHEYKTL